MFESKGSEKTIFVLKYDTSARLEVPRRLNMGSDHLIIPSFVDKCMRVVFLDEFLFKKTDRTGSQSL